MNLARVQFISWDKAYYFNPQDLKLRVGDLAMVTTEFGAEVGQIVGFEDLNEARLKELGVLKPIDRLATDDDLAVINQNNSADKKTKTIDYCRKAAKKHNLALKIIDCYFSFDDKRLVIAFIADGRVDFREMVKDLARYFQRSIRLHQLGVRDEAKIDGDFGSCGRRLCCANYLKELGNVTSELAEEQQVAHRGSERLSGACGRLKCCLAYEQAVYKKLSEKLPAIGTRVSTKHGRGVVVGWHILKGSVDVKIDPREEKDKDKKDKEDYRALIVEVPIQK